MAERLVSMEVRVAIAAFCMVDDGEASVTKVCEQLGISRDTFYRYRARFHRLALERRQLGVHPADHRRPLASDPG